MSVFGLIKALCGSEVSEELNNVSRKVRKGVKKLVENDVKAKAKTVTRRQKGLEKLSTRPDEIRVRDLTRDGIMTSLKLTILSLVHWVPVEYFGGVKMEWRTFIVQLIALPVTVRSHKTRLLYQIAANPRHPRLMALLSGALEEINNRGIKRGKQLMVFELVERRARGS